MHAQLIIDDRIDTTQVIRTKGDRRKSKTLLHLLTPFRNSCGKWIRTDHRSGNNRRNLAEI